VVLGFAWRLLSGLGLGSAFELSPSLLGAALYAIVFLNLSIFAFQLLPIPGLDGWAVIEAIFRNRNPRFFFEVNSRRQQIWVGCIVVIFLFQIFQGASLLNVVMTPFYLPASLISLGGCSGYAIPGFIGLRPCPLP
jgi:Zn-dependent protease